MQMRRITRKRKILEIKGLLMALVLAGSIGVSGCQVGKTKVVFTSGFSDKEVFRVGGKVCSLSEAKVFLTNYQNLYGTAYGVNLWEQDFGEQDLEQYIKDLTVSQLARIISMDFLAEEQKISLTDEELGKVKQAAEAYYDSLNKEEIKYMDVNEACIVELYRQYALANKLYAHLTEGISDEVSDDDARVMEAYQIYVTTKEKADAVAAGLAAGTDFLTLAGTYNETESSAVTFGRGQMPKEVEAVAFALDPKGVSQAIQTEKGYYFIKCINNYNQELTDANKKVILEQRRKEAFDDVYDSFVKTLPSELNEELWNDVKVEVSDDVRTDSFFEIYEKFFDTAY